MIDINSKLIRVELTAINSILFANISDVIMNHSENTCQ